MRNRMPRTVVSMLLVVLAACGKSQVENAPLPTPDSGAQAALTEGPTPKPGGGLVAEPSGVQGNLAIEIRWSSEVVTGIPAEGVTTTVYRRNAQLQCPVTSSDESPASYFAALDNPNGDPLAATGSYQPWWNEECTGSLTIDDTYHADDPTLAGPEPIVRTTGTQPLNTSDTPLTVETDLNRARTRYLFISPGAGGFQQQAAKGYEAKLVAASAAPMATMDFTLEGPVGDGKQEVAVQGGILQVSWTFTRGRPK